jgi:hypothetical protein
VKVEQSSGPRSFAQRNVSEGRSGLSFAQLLASGHSVGSIRNERAFGFSETGIMGAGRFSSQAEKPAVSNRILQTGQDVRELIAAKANTAAATFKSSPSESAFSKGVGAKGITGVGKMAAPQSLVMAQSSQSTHNASIALPRPSRSSLSQALINGPQQMAAYCATRRQKSNRNDLELSIIEENHSISINVRHGGDDQGDEDALFSEFYTICWQFGVTLKTVTLF